MAHSDTAGISSKQVGRPRKTNFSNISRTWKWFSMLASLLCVNTPTTLRKLQKFDREEWQELKSLKQGKMGVAQRWIGSSLLLWHHSLLAVAYDQPSAATNYQLLHTINHQPLHTTINFNHQRLSFTLASNSIHSHGQWHMWWIICGPLQHPSFSVRIPNNILFDIFTSIILVMAITQHHRCDKELCAYLSLSLFLSCV